MKVQGWGVGGHHAIDDVFQTFLSPQKHMLTLIQHGNGFTKITFIAFDVFKMEPKDTLTLTCCGRCLRYRCIIVFLNRPHAQTGAILKGGETISQQEAKKKIAQF